MTPEETRRAIGASECWGCGVDIADALVACPVCFDRLPSEVRNPLFAIGPQEDRQAAVDAARGWLHANPSSEVSRG